MVNVFESGSMNRIPGPGGIAKMIIEEKGGVRERARNVVNTSLRRKDKAHGEKKRLLASIYVAIC